MAQSQTPVKGSDRVPLPGAKAIGAAHGEQWVEVTVKVKRKAELPDLTGRPKTKMTREELAAKYGANAQDVEKLAAQFRAMGLDVIHTDANSRIVELGGTVSAMNAAFGVKLMQFAHAGEAYRGRVGPIHVPDSVSDLVEGVFGLDNRRVNKRKANATTTMAAAVAKAKSRPWFYPEELAKIYNFPLGDGTGQSIGLLEFDGGYFESDLKQFCADAKVPVPTVVPISVDGTPTNTLNDAAIEVMLDVEVVAGVCPKATIPVYFSSFTEKGWINALDAVIQDTVNEPSVLSISWGNSEDGAWWTQSAITQVNEAFKEAALLGITICVASGDDGSSDGVLDGHAHVDFPASSPYVLAVGGTTLRKSAGGHSEVAWKDGDGLRQDNGGSTGGGVSLAFAPPAWQSSVAIASVNPAGKPGRVIPDVAADASAHTGYFMVIAGKVIHEGGTSASAPLWAGLIGRMNASLAASSKRVGYLTPVLYQAASPGGATVGALGCKDIVKGENNTSVVGGYTSSAGYDAVTGWGSPNGAALLTAVAPLL